MARPASRGFRPGWRGSTRPFRRRRRGAGPAARRGRGCRRSAAARTEHGAEEGAAAPHRRARSPRARPARAAAAPEGLAALLAGLRDADTARLGPPAAGAGLGRRSPRESPPAAARPPPVLRRGPPGHAEVLAVATRRAVLLAPHPRPARLHGAELGPREGLGHPDLQRQDGERGPGGRTGHVPRLAACAQARGGGLHRFRARVRGYFALCALPAAAPGYDSSGATEKWGHQYGGAHAESGEDTHSSLGLPGETSDKEKGQGHCSLKCRNRQAASRVLRRWAQFLTSSEQGKKGGGAGPSTCPFVPVAPAPRSD